MSPNEPTEIPRTSRSHRRAWRHTGQTTLAALVLMLAGVLGCATGAAPPSTPSVDAAADPATPTAPTVAAAAHAALERIHDSTDRRDRGAMLAGAIVEVDGGYAGLAPNRSSERGRAVVRLRVDQRQVATFVVHPRTGNGEVDRANEAVTRAERRLVDEFDPEHRPIFVLTPKGRILAYRHEGDVVEIADLRTGRDVTARGDASGSQVAGLDR